MIFQVANLAKFYFTATHNIIVLASLHIILFELHNLLNIKKNLAALQSLTPLTHNLSDYHFALMILPVSAAIGVIFSFILGRQKTLGITFQ